MKPTYEIKPEVLDNLDLFHDPFYKRFQLRHAPKPILLKDGIEKNYLFPTFYGDVTCAQAIFMCDYDRAQKMMLHPKIKPVRMPRGRSLVAFSCYIYRNVLGVAPYNEIAMTIPVMVDPKFNVPVLPMILDRFPEFGFYVFSMPVTSLENQLRGLNIWGLPKVVQEITVRLEGNDCVTVANEEESGEPYFELRVPTDGKPEQFDVTTNLYSKFEGKLLQSPTAFKATFRVKKYMDQLLKKGAKPDRPYLTIGDTPSGRVLRDLQIEEHPFQFRYAQQMTACFDLANPGYDSPIQFE